MMIQSVKEFFVSGGMFMYPLALCSILLVAAVVYRLLILKNKDMLPPNLVSLIESCMGGGGDCELLKSATASGDSPMARLVHFILSSPKEDAESLRRKVEVRAREEFISFQSGLPLLDIIIMVAPMLGILGTASGLVIVFNSFGTEDHDGMIAAGIACALNTTITGLAIATPAVIANIWFGRRLEQVSGRMEVLLDELVSMHCK